MAARLRCASCPWLKWHIYGTCILLQLEAKVGAAPHVKKEQKHLLRRLFRVWTWEVGAVG